MFSAVANDGEREREKLAQRAFVVPLASPTCRCERRLVLVTEAVRRSGTLHLLQVMPAVCRCLGEGGNLIVLIKPQFEATREQIGRGGLVKDPAVHAEVRCRPPLPSEPETPHSKVGRRRWPETLAVLRCQGGVMA